MQMRDLYDDPENNWEIGKDEGGEAITAWWGAKEDIISVRSAITLTSLGILYNMPVSRKIAILSAMTEADLLKVAGCGRVTVKNIREWLNANGADFAS